MNKDTLIQIAGRRYVLNGEQFIPRGMNLGNWLHIENYMHGLPSVENDMRRQMMALWGERRTRRYWKVYRDTYIQESDFARIADMRCNCVRIPLNVNMFDETAVFGENVFHYLDQAFEWAAKHDIFIQLELHALPGGQARDHNADPYYGTIPAFWNHESFQRKALDALGALAQRYAGETHLWAYSPACEPNTSNIELLNEYYQKSIACIRRYDPDHIILLEPNHWARDVSSLSDSLFADPQVSYQIHIYFFFHCDVSRMNDYPSTTPDYPFGRAQLEQMVNGCLDDNRIPRPVTLGEFGVPWKSISSVNTSWQPHETATMAKASRDIRRIMEDRGGGWCLWAYKDKGGMGSVYCDRDTAWMRLLNRESLRELREYVDQTFSPDFADNPRREGTLQKQLRERFLHDDNDTIASTVLSVKRSVETLLLRHILREMHTLTDEQLDACASSFELAQCRVRNEVGDIILAD